MATIPHPDEPTLDIREQIARIDRIQAELQKNQAEINKWQSEALRGRIRDQAELDKWQVDMAQARAQATKLEKDAQLAPWGLAFTGVTAGAAVFAAGAVFMKLIAG